MKKKLYICGDSFCTKDPEHGTSWADKFEQLHPELEIHNFSSIGASNYLIYLQVKEALEQKSDYVIFHATSSVRQEFMLIQDQMTKDCVDRYWRQDRPTGSLRCNSWLNVQKNLDGLFSKKQRKVLQKYFVDFFDWPSQIEKNFVFICHTLNLLHHDPNLVSWAWSRGGFNHKKFTKEQDHYDFSQHAKHECNTNLWDYYVPDVFRPHFHVSDSAIIYDVCESYKKMLKL